MEVLNGFSEMEKATALSMYFLKIISRNSMMAQDIHIPTMKKTDFYRYLMLMEKNLFAIVMTYMETELPCVQQMGILPITGMIYPGI